MGGAIIPHPGHPHKAPLVFFYQKNVSSTDVLSSHRDTVQQNGRRCLGVFPLFSVAFVIRGPREAVTQTFSSFVFVFVVWFFVPVSEIIKQACVK